MQNHWESFMCLKIPLRSRSLGPHKSDKAKRSHNNIVRLEGSSRNQISCVTFAPLVPVVKRLQNVACQFKALDVSFGGVVDVHQDC